MRVVVELSGEHPGLPEAEVRAVAEPSDVRRDGRVLVADVPGPVAWGRLALSHAVGRHLASVRDLDALLAEAAAWGEVGSPFAVRASSLSGSWPTREVERRLGEVLGKGREVDLEAPASVVRVVGAERLHAHLLVHDVDRAAFEARKSHKRPFFQPTSLHPRLARAMVNLARPERGLLDPFCGTGGILMEAALLGIPAVGADVDGAMVRGSRTNVDHVGADAHLLQADVRHLPVEGGVDAVATDPPYGRSTRTAGAADPGTLRDALFEAAGGILERGDRLVACLPEPVEVPDGWSLVERHRVRVHRSLTRHVHVLVRR